MRALITTIDQEFEDLKKARVKAYTRVRRGRMERVPSYETRLHSAEDISDEMKISNLILRSIKDPSLRGKRGDTVEDAISREIFNFGAHTVARVLGFRKLPKELMPVVARTDYSAKSKQLGKWMTKELEKRGDIIDGKYKIHVKFGEVSPGERAQINEYLRQNPHLKEADAREPKGELKRQLAWLKEKPDIGNINWQKFTERAKRKKTGGGIASEATTEKERADRKLEQKQMGVKLSKEDVKPRGGHMWD